MDLLKLSLLIASFFFARAFDLKDAIIPEMQQREIVIQKIATCPETSRSTAIRVDLENATIVDDMLKSKLIVTVTRNISDEISQSLRVDRCDLNERFEKCVQVHTFHMDNFCEALKINSLWQMTVADFKPKLECPMRKDVYVAKNFTFDMKSVFVFLKDQTYLRITTNMRGKRNNWKLCCIVAEMRLKKKTVGAKI